MRLSFFPVPLFLGLAISLAFPLDVTANPPSIEMGSRGVSNFLAKMEKDRKAHVAFLGGSITEKAGGHSGLVASWLKENWPDVDFTFTNAGLSSTCSVSGTFRLNRDVLAKGQVDLLIVEFAVNDDQDAAHDRETAIRGLEGVIRQYYQSNPKGDVISVQFVNPQILQKIQAGESATSVAAHKDVARHYDIPIVDVGLELAKKIKDGSMTWKSDYGGTHPNAKGYEFATRLITSVIEETTSGETPQIISLPPPLNKGSYFSATTIDPQVFAWLGGWKFGSPNRSLLPVGQIRSTYEKFQALRSDEAGNFLYGTFKGSMIGAFILAGPDAGILEVCIDNGEWKAVDLYHHYSGGLNYPRSVILADNLSNQFHSIAIRVSSEKNPKSKGTAATILYFQVNQ